MRVLSTVTSDGRGRDPSVEELPNTVETPVVSYYSIVRYVSTGGQPFTSDSRVQLSKYRIIEDNNAIEER